MQLLLLDARLGDDNQLPFNSVGGNFDVADKI